MKNSAASSNSNSKLPPGLAIPSALYDAMAEACSPQFAFSYLSKASMVGRKLLPYTHIAWERLRASPAAMAVLSKLGVELMEPEPFNPHREDVRQAA
jgi:hypothetical protein